MSTMIQSNHLKHCPKHRKKMPCPHCVILAKPAPAPSIPVIEAPVRCPIPAFKGVPISEDDLRHKFGVEKPNSKSRIPKSYRQLLNLDPQDIVDFFDVKIGENEEFTQVDFIIPPAMLEHRVKRLQKIINRAKEIVEGLDARVRKTTGGDVLDKATREKFKREESARLTRCYAKRAKYYQAAKQLRYTEKIWQWVTKPIYFRDAIDDEMHFDTVLDTKWEEGDAVFTGGLHTHNLTDLVDYLKRGYFDLCGYKILLKLDDAALTELGETEEERKATWDNCRTWENHIIRFAILHHIITPRRDLAELLGLGSVLDDYDDDPDDVDHTEDALAFKTGGACYGGRIKSEGFRYRGGKIKPRALSSFDKPLRPRKLDDADAGYQDAGFGNLHQINDDAESYDPR